MTITAPTDRTRRIAVLGTGIMGAPIARHLSARGHAVRAWDIDRARLAALAQDGVCACASAGDAADSAEIIITMLTDAEVTHAIAGEALGRFSGLWIQSATVGLEGTRRLLELARRHGVAMIDAPLLGTKSSAQDGELIALASGPEAHQALCRSVLDAFSRRVLWLGEAGQGSRLKLVMNNWVLGLTTLTAETIALASGLGLDGQIFLEIIEGGPLDVAQAQIKGTLMQREAFPPALPLRLAAKDAHLIVAAAEEAGLELPVGRAVASLLERAREAGHGDDDVAAVYRAVAGPPVTSADSDPRS